MGKIECLACGAVNPHTMVRCGKYKGYICENHCYEGCEFLGKNETTIVHCFYRDRKEEEKKKLSELQEEQFQEKIK